jgi:hypothetical protein
MLPKLERYVSKNIPQTALLTVQKQVNLIPKDYQGNPLTENTIYRWHGYIQRKNIEPKELLPSQNTKRIGYHQRAQLGPYTNAERSITAAEHGYNRKAIISFGEINHMQSTPMNRRGYWNIITQNTGFVRSHSMLWQRAGDDVYHKWGDRDEMRFATVEEAQDKLEAMGFEYEVVYPHERYHQTKAYADNFNFIREGVSDIEDEEAAAFEIMQKLV